MTYAKTIHVALYPLLLCLLGSTAARAETIAYRSVGEFGEATFSDIHNSTAETIVLPQSSQPALSSNELIAQMLTVAEDLERARLDRQAQRAANRIKATSAPAQPQRDVVTSRTDRYPIFFPQRPYHPRPHHPRPDHPRPPHKPEPKTPSKTFRFAPDL